MSFTREARSRNHAHALGVVIVGCGYWGRNYVRVLDSLPGSRVLAVCDQSPDRLESIGAAFPGAHLTTSLEEALALPEVHAAVVCTPASTHYAVARDCLMRGVHVLVEKPMTTSSSDAAALIELADAEDLTLMAGHTFVYNPGVRKIKQYVDRGDVGRIYYLYARRTNLGPIRRDVGALWDLAPHDIAIFDYLLEQRPVQVSAVGSCLLHQEREDVGFVTLTYPGNVVALIHVSWADPNKTREVVVVGSDKRIMFNDLDPLERVRVFNKGVTRGVEEASAYGEFTFDLRDGDILSPMIEVTEPLKNQCEHFLHCLRSGERPLTDGHAGRRVVEVMEAIDLSLPRTGEHVAVTADSETHDRSQARAGTNGHARTASNGAHNGGTERRKGVDRRVVISVDHDARSPVR